MEVKSGRPTVCVAVACDVLDLLARFEIFRRFERSASGRPTLDCRAVACDVLSWVGGIRYFPPVRAIRERTPYARLLDFSGEIVASSAGKVEITEESY